MFRILLAHPQEVLDKRRLVYCVPVMSVALKYKEALILNKLSKNCARLF
jgi:hypothetical protein